MKKYLLGLAGTSAVLAASVAAPAFAHDGFFGFGSHAKVDVKLLEYSTSSQGGASSVDNVCVQSAVSAREQSLVNGLAAFNAAEMSALTTRKTALASAWGTADVSARRVAVKAAWDAYLKADKEAMKQWKSSQKSVWSTFRTSVRNCNGAASAEVNLEASGHL